jgi:hypothetical protein
MAKWGNINIAFGSRERSSVVLTDMISYYAFEDDFNDSVGNNDAINNAVNFSLPKVGLKSGRFITNQTTTAYLTIPYSTDFDFSNVTNSKPFSVSAWVYITEDKDGWIVNKRDSTSTNEFQLAYRLGSFQFAIFDQDKTDSTGVNTFIRSIFTPQTSVLNRWINVVGVFDGVNDCKIYVNNQEGSIAEDVNGFEKIKNFNQTVKIGAAGFDIGILLAFKGRIDEVYIFNKALNTSQVATVYNKGVNSQSLI